MCSGSGVTLSGSGLSMMFLVGVTGEGFLNIPGFLRLIRRRSRHSRTHLLHQIVHVTKLSTDVMTKSTSNSSIMMIVLPSFFGYRRILSFFSQQSLSALLFFLCSRSLVWSDWSEKKLWPLLGSRDQKCFFLCHLWFSREKIGVSLVPFSSSFCFPKFWSLGRSLKGGAGEK